MPPSLFSRGTADDKHLKPRESAALLADRRGRESNVPERVIERLLGKVEFPTWAECHGRMLIESAEDSGVSRL